MKISFFFIKTSLFVLLLGAFLLPGKYSFWPEFHQAASAVAIAIVFSIPLFFKRQVNLNFSALFLILTGTLIAIDLFIGRENFSAFNFYGLLYLLSAIVVSLYVSNEGENDFLNILSLAMILISLI